MEEEQKMEISTDEIEEMLKEMERDDKCTNVENTSSEINPVENSDDPELRTTKTCENSSISEPMQVDSDISLNLETSVVTESKIEDPVESSEAKETSNDTKIEKLIESASEIVETSEEKQSSVSEIVEVSEEKEEKQSSASETIDSSKEPTSEIVETLEEKEENLPSPTEVVNSIEDTDENSSSPLKVCEENSELKQPSTLDIDEPPMVVEKDNPIEEPMPVESKVEDDSLVVEKVIETIQEPSTSTSIAEPSVKPHISGTPEDILNLLKSLSPEKLEQIKSKVLEITTESKDDKPKETAVVEEPTSSTIDQPSEEKSSNPTNDVQMDDEDVICLDSDDEQMPQSKTLEPKQSEANHHRKSPVQNGTKQELKECVNPECPRNVNDEYSECPLFVMNLYYIGRKPNKTQWICLTCFESALEIYDELCTNINNNIPWTSVKIPKKQDLVEIIDSDDEDEPSGK